MLAVRLRIRCTFKNLLKWSQNVVWIVNRYWICGLDWHVPWLMQKVSSVNTHHRLPRVDEAAGYKTWLTHLCQSLLIKIWQNLIIRKRKALVILLVLILKLIVFFVLCFWIELFYTTQLLVTWRRTLYLQSFEEIFDFLWSPLLLFRGVFHTIINWKAHWSSDWSWLKFVARVWIAFSVPV